MENFATRGARIGGEEKGGESFQREKLSTTEGFIQIDRQDVLFSAEGTAGLLLAILPSALVRVIKQGAYERSPLLCSVSLPVSVSDLL